MLKVGVSVYRKCCGRVSDVGLRGVEEGRRLGWSRYIVEIEERKHLRMDLRIGIVVEVDAKNIKA